MKSGQARMRVLEAGWSVAAAARALAAAGEEPFYVFDAGEPAARLRSWRALMPRVDPFYAVKCNDDPLLLRTLAALGAGFDCASRAEIELVTGLGVAPERIIFAHTAKLPSHLRHAARVGVTLMTFDSSEELHKIKQLVPHAQLVLRIRCDSEQARCPLGAKFGCEPEQEAPRLLELAAKLGLDVAGFSFHVGSDTAETEPYARGVRLCGALRARAAALGLRPRLLDVGGGFRGEAGADLQEVAAVINAALETHFPERSVRVIAEPGRYFAAAAYTLVACVFAKRTLPAPAGQRAHTQYYLNDGVYGSFMDCYLEGKPPQPQLLQPSAEAPQPCSLWGPTCDALDCVLAAARLPPLPVGDWLLFREHGAYSLTLASTFNGFPLPKVYGFVDTELWQSDDEILEKSRAPIAILVFLQELVHLFTQNNIRSVLKDLSPFTAADFEIDESETPSPKK